jgi:hypothetical protein
MSPVVPSPSPNSKKIHRNVLKIDWTATTIKGLEAVTETDSTTTNAYYQVTNNGKEVLQTISYSEAEAHYNSLP